MSTYPIEVDRRHASARRRTVEPRSVLAAMLAVVLIVGVAIGIWAIAADAARTVRDGLDAAGRGGGGAVAEQTERLDATYGEDGW